MGEVKARLEVNNQTQQTNAAKKIDITDKQMQHRDKCNRKTNATISDLSFKCQTKLNDGVADGGL